MIRRALLVAVAALSLSGCSAVSHWSQAAGGHLALMRAARPVDDWLADPATERSGDQWGAWGGLAKALRYQGA